MYGLVNFIMAKNWPSQKLRNIRPCFLICQVICYSVIEESAHVIGTSQSTGEEGTKEREMVRGRRRRRRRG